jgi:hypothetical protein
MTRVLAALTGGIVIAWLLGYAIMRGLELFARAVSN